MKQLLPIALIVCLTACAESNAPPASGAATDTGQLARPIVDASHSSDDVQKYLRMGQAAQAKGKPDVALMLFHSAAMADKDDPAPRLAAAEAMEDTGDTGGAATLYEALIAQDKSHDPTLQLAAGRVWLKQQDNAKAAGHYQAVVAATGDWRAYDGLGIARGNQHDLPAADAAFKAALDAAPADRKADVRANWARARIAGQDNAGAVALLTPGQQDGTATPDEVKLLALAGGKLGNADVAKAPAP